MRIGPSAGTAIAAAKSRWNSSSNGQAPTQDALRTFAFCDQALGSLDDSKLGEQLPFFGGKTKTRASIMTLTVGDWADHYSQFANYMRLNGLTPPTAQKKPAA